MLSTTLNRSKSSGMLLQSVRPLLILFRFIGINLDLVDNPPNGKIRFTFGLFMLALNICTTVSAVVYVSSTIEKRNPDFKTFAWNVFIHQVTYLYNSVGTHVSLLKCVKTCWKDLWAALTEIELRLDLKEEYYRKIRRLCIFGIVFITTKVTLFFKKLKVSSNCFIQRRYA